MKVETIRPIKEDEFLLVRDIISRTKFLPKWSWPEELCDMAYGGLISGKWTGIGCFSDQNELMAYLDYKEHLDGEIEVGIVFTREYYQGRGIMKLMLKFLMARFPKNDITIGTYERNGGMICCIQSLGFEEESRQENDRIDGSATIHYRHTSGYVKVNNNINMRKMKVSDLEKALALWRKTPGVVVREYDDSVEGFIRFLSRNPETSLVLELSEEIVGTLLCGNDGRRAFLYHFVVREDLRGKGLGKQLLNAAYKHLIEQGVPKAGLVALQENKDGLNFWTHNNWILRDDLYYLDVPLQIL